MSKKHNTKHHRSKSHYPERLRKRGLSRTPKMTYYADLMARPKREQEPSK